MYKFSGNLLLSLNAFYSMLLRIPSTSHLQTPSTESPNRYLLLELSRQPMLHVGGGRWEGMKGMMSGEVIVVVGPGDVGGGSA